jgi:hypothetical protein
MRALFGIVLGVALTIGGAYVYDSHNATAAASGNALQERPLVNWDVVSQKCDIIAARAREGWLKLTG